MEKKEDNRATTKKVRGSNCNIVITKKAGTCVVSIEGELDFSSSPRVYAYIQQQSQTCDKSLIIDLSKLTFMDSSGLQVLLRLREKYQHPSRALLLVKPKPQIAKLFKLTGFEKMFPIFDDVNQAQAYFEFRQK